MIETYSARPRSIRPTSAPRARLSGGPRLALALVMAALLTACLADPTTTQPAAPVSIQAAPSQATAAASPMASTEPADTSPPTPAPTPEPPPLSLDLPPMQDPRQIDLVVTPQVAPDGGGQITVSVTSRAEDMVEELVLRWPTDLAGTLFLSPFIPDPDLIREGGPNLVRPWTKWVIGPGEHGEPAGTTSLGYGPLMPAATLNIPLYVTRIGPGPVGFDLQLLAGELILTLPDGTPAELRVEVP